MKKNNKGLNKDQEALIERQSNDLNQKIAKDMLIVRLNDIIKELVGQ